MSQWCCGGDVVVSRYEPGSCVDLLVWRVRRTDGEGFAGLLLRGKGSHSFVR